MAGDWIKMRTDLADDPAVIGMSMALGVDEHAIVGRLHKLWSWADKHCDNGHAKSVTFVWIDRYVCLDSFADCMAAVGWIEEIADGVTFPKFDRHNGKSAKIRAEASNRKRKERIQSEQAKNDEKSRILAEEIKRKEDEKAQIDAEMSQQKRDENATREEKRREEKKLSKPTPAAVPAAPVDIILAHDSAPYATGFEQAFAAYPARCGGNPKRDAQQAWNARIAEGVSAADMLAGALRYAAHANATGKTGSEFVMQAVRFFGKSKHFLDAWAVSPVVALVRPSRSTAAMGSNAVPFDDPFAQPPRPAQGASA